MEDDEVRRLTTRDAEGRYVLALTCDQYVDLRQTVLKGTDGHSVVVQLLDETRTLLDSAREERDQAVGVRRGLEERIERMRGTMEAVAGDLEKKPGFPEDNALSRRLRAVAVAS